MGNSFLVFTELFPLFKYIKLGGCISKSEKPDIFLEISPLKSGRLNGLLENYHENKWQVQCDFMHRNPENEVFAADCLCNLNLSHNVAMALRPFSYPEDKFGLTVCTGSQKFHQVG